MHLICHIEDFVKPKGRQCGIIFSRTTSFDLSQKYDYLRNGCVSKLGFLHHHTIVSLYIYTSCSLAFGSFNRDFNYIGNTHIVPQIMNINFLLYLDNFIFFLYKLSLVINQIRQLTAGDKHMYFAKIKISETTINGHLKPENTVITKESIRKLNNNLL